MPLSYPYSLQLLPHTFPYTLGHATKQLSPAPIISIPFSSARHTFSYTRLGMRPSSSRNRAKWSSSRS